MEKNQERQHALTEIEAEISELRHAPAPNGQSRRALRERADYYKQILDLYAEKEQLVQKSVQALREQKAHSSERKFRKMISWG